MTARIPFSLTYWASDYPVQEKLGRVTEDIWHNFIMSQGRAFAAVGGTPDQFVIESWIGLPGAALPETNSVTFMGSVPGFRPPICQMMMFDPSLQQLGRQEAI